MEKPVAFSDLWQVENALWSAEDRVLAIEIAFNVLLVTNTGGSGCHSWLLLDACLDQPLSLSHGIDGV